MNYGIWIRGQGWVRTVRGPVAFGEEEVAQDTARRVHGEVRPIDESLVDLEASILQIEEKEQPKGFIQRLKIWRK